MLVAGVVCVSLLFQLVRDDPVWLFRPTVPNALRADRMRIDAFKAHNSPLKTNDVNQRGGVLWQQSAGTFTRSHQLDAVWLLEHPPSKSSFVWGPQVQEPF